MTIKSLNFFKQPWTFAPTQHWSPLVILVLVGTDSSSLKEPLNMFLWTHNFGIIECVILPLSQIKFFEIFSHNCSIWDFEKTLPSRNLIHGQGRRTSVAMGEYKARHRLRYGLGSTNEREKRESVKLSDWAIKMPNRSQSWHDLVTSRSQEVSKSSNCSASSEQFTEENA